MQVNFGDLEKRFHAYVQAEKKEGREPKHYNAWLDSISSTDKPVDAITIINRLVPLLNYLELTALENALQTRRYNMRKAEGENFKSIEEVK